MKGAVYCGIISAVVGFIVAAYLSTSPGPPHWMSLIFVHILCPPYILITIAGLSLADPDMSSIWIVGLFNAAIYGIVGLVLWQLWQSE
jgi:hypothetical protein